jgi:hypothetical protein
MRCFYILHLLVAPGPIAYQLYSSATDIGRSSLPVLVRRISLLVKLELLAHVLLFLAERRKHGRCIRAQGAHLG